MWDCIFRMKVNGDCVLAADIGMSLVLFDDLIPDAGTIDNNRIHCSNLQPVEATAKVQT